MYEHNLLTVPVGGSAVIGALGAGGAVRKRLLDLGLLPGTSVRCLYEAPSGNPKAYLVRDTVIALRNCDALKISLTATR